MNSRASVRRALALLPDGGRLSLAAALAEPLPAEAGELIVGYLFDCAGGAILATSEARAKWLDGPLFRWVGPGNAAPITDDVAALIAGPLLARDGAVSPDALARRFAPRADDAIALAVAALPKPAQGAALEALVADAGPEPELLALSTVQCGRVIAWSPHLLELAIAERVVSALLALLEPSRPKPLLELAARALGPIGARPGALGERVRTAALAGIDAVARPAPRSFSDEVAAIGKPHALDRMLALPGREVAEACAYILGFASPLDRAAFVGHRALVLDRPDTDLVVPFLDGLVAAAHVPAVAELAAALLDGGDEATALGLAATLPLDPLATALVAELGAAAPSRRALACAAVELLDDEDVDPELAVRLGDPSPEVAAAATRSLLARGRRDLIGKHSAREVHPVRRAIALAGLGELDVPVIGELVRGLLDEDLVDASPIAKLVGDCLLGSVAGLDVASDLIGGVGEAAGLLALVSVPDDGLDVGVLAPPAQRQRLATATLGVATAADPDDELGALALYLLARMSAGDATIAEVVADALSATDGQAGNLVGALGECRVASAATAAVIAPLVGPDSPIGARITTAAVCGRTLPRDHEAWRHVRELLALGTIARAAAWSALRDRARRA